MSITAEMVVEECCNCGIAFAMPEEFKKKCRDNPGPNGKAFYCPNGHGQHYTAETEADKLRRERNKLKQNEAYLEERLAAANLRAQDARTEAEHARHQANGYKGAMRRVQKRVSVGVCACCNRTFTDLARHMASQHPNFGKDDPAPLKVVDGGKTA